MKILMFIVLLFTPVFANAFQDLTSEKLQEQLHTFYQRRAPLKIHLFLNQSTYIPGDTLWFSATVVHANGLASLLRSSILNVVLIGSDRQVICRDKVRLNTSFGAGQLIIPPSATPGNYLLVAYHDWMRDTSPGLYYQRMVRIAGEKELVVPPEYKSVAFFPEGGALVEGVSNKVVVHGAPQQFGKVRDNSGKEVGSFSTGSSGHGFFYLNPAPGISYEAEVSGSDAVLTLPQAVKVGVSILATLEDNSTRLRAILQKGPALPERKVSVVVDQQNTIQYAAAVTIKGEYATLNIPLKDLSPGVARLTIFDDDEQVLAERLFFVNNAVPISVDPGLDKRVFSTREKVALRIRLSAPGKALTSRLSVSVFKKPSANTITGKTIVNDLLLFGDVNVTHASDVLFDVKDPASVKAIDNFLITKTWQRAPWDEVRSDQNEIIPYLNIRFTGRAEDEQTGKPLPDSTLITFFLQQNATTFQTYVRNGRIDMALFLDFYGREEVYYRAEYNGKVVPDAKLTLEEDTLFPYEWPKALENPRSDPYYAQRIQQRNVNESFSVFDRRAVYRKNLPAGGLIEDEIFGPDIEIDLDKYIVFPTMEETLREIIPMVQHRKVRNESVVRIYFPDLGVLAREIPLYVIDGIVTDDTDFFMALKPADVSKIKVVNTQEKLQVFGAIGKGGLLLVETKIPGHAARVPRSKHSFTVQGLTEDVSARSVNVPVLAPRRPDLRTNLLWAPQVSTDKNGETVVTFYTSDVTGEFTIQMEGLTSDGLPFAAEETISVEFRRHSN